jgi:hypothetical protein
VSAIAAGAVLAGRFEVERSLGAGGFAEVFAALDLHTSSEVALKVLHQHLAEDPQIVERFRRELAVTRTLAHPGIVRVFDLHEHGDAAFFSMELLRGESLAARLARGPLAFEEARRIAREMCEALAAAHGAGVVHRDLKPQNVFLTESGAVKLLDFGLARAVGWSRLTATSTVMGTPGYIAPELMRGAGADARSDVYAVGATLFEMLTGQVAFAGSDPYETLRAQAGTAPSPHAANSAVPELDDAIVRRALDPDPELRFVDARQMLRALGGEQFPLAPPTLPGLVAGHFDVVVAPEWFKLGALQRVLGASVRAPALRRGQIFGSLTVVQGASRESAQAFAEHCRVGGLVASVRPAPRKRRLFRRPRLISILFGAAATLFVAGGARVLDAAPWAYAFSALLGALAGAVAWSESEDRVCAPFRDLPCGDPALWRIFQGIRGRLDALRARVRKGAPAEQMLTADLIDAAAQTEAAARQLTEQLAALPDAFAPATHAEAATLPHGFASSAVARDRGVARLLAVAGALDDALAAVETDPAPGLRRASQALRSLDEELAFARGALAATSPQPAS